VDRPEALIRLLPPCLHWHPDGEIRLTGHRIGLYHFVYYSNQGFTAEMLVCQFPTLELALVHKVIATLRDLPDGTTGPDGIIIAGIHVTLKMQFTGRALSFRPRDRPGEGGQPGVIRPGTPISRPATDSVRRSPGFRAES
jgi:hypothetical protein